MLKDLCLGFGLGAYGFGLGLEGPGRGLDLVRCLDNFLASPSNSNKIIN